MEALLRLSIPAIEAIVVVVMAVSEAYNEWAVVAGCSILDRGHFKLRQTRRPLIDIINYDYRIGLWT